MLRTLPSRIILGFVALILFSLLLGALSLWRITEINRNVINVATNSVPSIVAINRAIQSNFDATRAIRRLLLGATDASAVAKLDDSAFQTARLAGDDACRSYEDFVFDAEDAKLFSVATAARDSYLSKAIKTLDSLRQGKIDEAKQLMRDDVDPGLEACIAAFNEVVEYNTTVATQQVVEARENVGRSYVLIGVTLALAGLLGAILGGSIIRSMTRALGDVSTALESSATQTLMASSQLASASHSLAEGCSEQGSAVEQTSAALEQMSAMIRSTADNADKAKQLANQARGAAQAGVGTMQEMNAAMHAIETSSEEVAKIVKNIDEIAFQTNILALNAAVEAARAGEAGAGFAVVADEVRSLAQRSAAAAKETAAKIEAAIADSRRGSASCGRVGESLGEIVQKVIAADGLVAEIATAAKEQAQGIQQVTAAMAQMDEVTQGNAASAEQSAGAAEELKGQSHAMQHTVTLLRSLVGRRSAGAALPAEITPPMPYEADRHGRGLSGGRTITAVARPRMDRIPMPKESQPVADEEDKHFRNF